METKPLFCIRDHMGGFDQNYRSPLLDKITDCGTMITEYILPDEVKRNYAHLDFKFSAYLTISQRHFHKFKNMTPRVANERTNFLCSFNRSYHRGRKDFVMALILSGFFDPEYCSKWFAISDAEFLEFFLRMPNHLYRLHNLSLIDIAKILPNKIAHGGTDPCGKIKEDNDDLSDKISRSFITAVCETKPESMVPFPTEKFCYPVINKALWLAYAQPGYHKFLSTHLDIVMYDGINYGFDNYGDSLSRLWLYMEELLRLSQLDQTKRNELYELNRDRLEHNYQILNSGQLLQNWWKLDDIMLDLTMQNCTYNFDTDHHIVNKLFSTSYTVWHK